MCVHVMVRMLGPDHISGVLPTRENSGNMVSPQQTRSLAQEEAGDPSGPLVGRRGEAPMDRPPLPGHCARVSWGLTRKYGQAPADARVRSGRGGRSSGASPRRPTRGPDASPASS